MNQERVCVSQWLHYLNEHVILRVREDLHCKGHTTWASQHGNWKTADCYRISWSSTVCMLWGPSRAANSPTAQQEILFTYGIFNPWFTDCMKNVSMLGLFFNSSQWYKEIILNNFFICSLKTPCHKMIIMQNVYFLVCYIFSNLTGPICTHITPFIQQPRTYRWETKPVLRTGVQGPLYQDNSNDMQQLQGTIIIRQILYRFLFWYIFSFPQNFRHFIPYSWMKNEAFEARQFLSLLESKKQT